VLRMSEAVADPEKLALDALEIDSELEGTVKGVSDFGAFVDFGADTDGLVHKSQLSDSFVENPAEFVKVGDKVTVRIMRVDLDKRQVSLSMRSKDAPKASRGGGGRNKDDLTKYADFDDTIFISGTVKTVASYGAFVALDDGVTGLVHISQLAEGRVESVESVVSVGDAVKVRVINVADGKLSLAMCPPRGAPVMKTQAELDDPMNKGPKRMGGDDGLNRRGGDERVEDIWSDNTEPEWRDILKENTAETFDNVLELKL